jgi:hypothetical protein
MRASKRLISLTALLILGLSLACVKRIKVNGQDVAANKNKLGRGPTDTMGETSPAVEEPPAASGGEAPVPMPPVGRPEPLEISGGLSGSRTHFQSRSTITLSISEEALLPGEEFSLLNKTTDQLLIERQPLSLDLAAPLLSGYQLVAAPSDTYLRLYPTAPDMAGKLTYGDNELQLMTDGEAPKVARRSIVLRDFSVGAIQLLHFDGNRQRAGKLQGGISTFTTPTVRGGKSLLTTDLVPMINQ